jgi:hypothetical protein
LRSAPSSRSVTPATCAEIAEVRGPLGPKGARIYRVLVQKKPRHVYIEVREDQLEVLQEA